MLKLAFDKSAGTRDADGRLHAYPIRTSFDAFPSDLERRFADKLEKGRSNRKMRLRHEQCGVKPNFAARIIGPEIPVLDTGLLDSGGGKRQDALQSVFSGQPILEFRYSDMIRISAVS